MKYIVSEKSQDQNDVLVTCDTTGRLYYLPLDLLAEHVPWIRAGDTYDIKAELVSTSDD